MNSISTAATLMPKNTPLMMQLAAAAVCGPRKTMRSEVAFLVDFEMKEIPSAAASLRWFCAILFGGKPAVEGAAAGRAAGANS